MMTVHFISDLVLLGAQVVQESDSDRLSTVQALSSSQFNLVYNGFSLAIAAIFASALFFFNVRDRVGQKYQLALVVSALLIYLDQ